jgi:hypothetical protein
VTGPGRGRRRGSQISANFVLTQKDVRTLVAVVVHDCSQRGVAYIRDWSQAGHVLGELADEMRCFHWVRCRSQ